jgi:hypothetical protein
MQTQAQAVDEPASTMPIMNNPSASQPGVDYYAKWKKNKFAWGAQEAGTEAESRFSGERSKKAQKGNEATLLQNAIDD